MNTVTAAPAPPLHRNRDFVLLWSGSAVSVIGSTASTVAYPLLVLALTGSAAYAGLAGFFATLPMLLFQLPAGVLVDRRDRRRLMIWCDVLRALGLGTIVAALALDQLHVLHILVVGFAEATLTVCYGIAANAAVPAVVHSTQVAAALSRNEARERAATMIGTPLGGFLFGLGRVMPFLIDLITYLVSLVTLLFIKKDFRTGTDSEQRHARMVTEIGEGVRWLWRHPFLRTATLLVAGSNVMFRALFLVVIVMATALGATPATVGVMLGVAAAGGVLGSFAASWCERRLGLRFVVIGANWVWAVLMVVIGTTSDPYVLAAAYAAMWFVGPIWNVAITTFQLRTTPDRLQGRVIGTTNMLAQGALPVGALAGGLLLDGLGPTTAALTLAGWMLVLAGAATLSPSVRGQTHSRG